MATVYTPWVAPVPSDTSTKIRAFLTYTITDANGGQSTISYSMGYEVNKAKSKSETLNITFSGGNFNIPPIEITWSGSASYSTKGTFTKKTGTISIDKQHFALTISGQIYIGGPNCGADQDFTFVIPEKTSYAVIYDENTPSGSTSTIPPADQKKWYNEALSLAEGPACSDSSTGLLYDFVGWNTAADGSGTSYPGGSSYTSNAGVTLYAQWTKHYYPPIISNVTIERCASDGTLDDEGKYAKITCDCTISKWKVSTNTTLTTKTANLHDSGSTVSKTGTFSSSPKSSTATDVTFALSLTFGNEAFNTDTQYTGVITVTDNTSQPNKTATHAITLNTTLFPFDISANGKSISILKPASDEVDGLIEFGGQIGIDNLTDAEDLWEYILVKRLDDNIIRKCSFSELTDDIIESAYPIVPPTAHYSAVLTVFRTATKGTFYAPSSFSGGGTTFRYSHCINDYDYFGNSTNGFQIFKPGYYKIDLNCHMNSDEAGNRLMAQIYDYTDSVELKDLNNEIVRRYDIESANGFGTISLSAVYKITKQTTIMPRFGVYSDNPKPFKPTNIQLTGTFIKGL